MFHKRGGCDHQTLVTWSERKLSHGWAVQLRIDDSLLGPSLCAWQPLPTGTFLRLLHRIKGRNVPWEQVKALLWLIILFQNLALLWENLGLGSSLIHPLSGTNEVNSENLTKRARHWNKISAIISYGNTPQFGWTPGWRRRLIDFGGFVASLDLLLLFLKKGVRRRKSWFVLAAEAKGVSLRRCCQAEMVES